MFSHRLSRSIDDPTLARFETRVSLVNSFVLLPMNLVGQFTEEQQRRQRQIYEHAFAEALAVIRPSRPQRLYSEIRN
jgi:hypothetical protein